MLLAGAPGCLSIQWRDAAGLTRHAGLVAVREVAGPRGAAVRRLSLGLDVRLCAPDPGVTLGYRDVTWRCPEVRRFRNGARLAEDVARHLAPGELSAPSPSPSWHLFWYGDGAHPAASASFIRSRRLGFDVSGGGPGTSLVLGYGERTCLVHEVVGRDAVHLLQVDPDDSDRFTHLLWLLGPE